MKIIDADKLHYIRKWFEDSGKSEVVVFAKEIDKAPTVQAIPIEWIKNVWLKNPDNQGEIDFFPPATFEVVMNWLIEDWEKENDQNKESTPQAD